MVALSSQKYESHPPSINVHASGSSIFHSTTSSSLQLVQPMSKIVTAKLEDGNFLTWKQRVLIAIWENDLEDFIIGDSAIPPHFTVDESGAQAYSPDFVAHHRQDQLLTSWLLSSISSDLLPHFVGLNSTRDVWNAINQLFVAQSTAGVMNYKLHWKI